MPLLSCALSDLQCLTRINFCVFCYLHYVIAVFVSTEIKMLVKCLYIFAHVFIVPRPHYVRVLGCDRILFVHA